jgi:aspartyl-tRNA(Asn)/glutamyl-tRNA(Gln) amidotransferase subunit A
MTPLATLAADLADGRTTSAEMTEAALARIDDPAGEGKRTFIRVFHEASRAEAAASDRLRGAGVVRSPIEGLPISIKDLCDVAGYTTLAGSTALADAPPATHDAPVVARLRAAGAVIVGTTNMVEFAFGGLGLNPHYGTPRSPWDRETGRIPGGSSSGGAVSVTDGMAAAALGTDTAGSVRMPSAACGLTGFKPTARRVPLDGIVPLSRSLDSVGPLAPTVDCCATLDAVFSGTPPTPLDDLDVAGLRFAVPQTVVMDDLEDAVADTFAYALSRLSAAGARIVEIPFAELARMPEINRLGGFPLSEGYAWHRRLLERAGDKYDPVIVQRLRTGAQVTAADYIDLLDARAEMIAIANSTSAPFDALAMPTLPIVPAPIAPLEDDPDLWLQTNLKMIRNNGLANFLDRCAMTLPCHARGAAPVGFMLFGETMGDKRLLAIGKAVEAVLTSAAK